MTSRRQPASRWTRSQSLRKQREQSLEELAAAQATGLLAEVPEKNGRKLVVRTFSDRDPEFSQAVWPRN